MSVEANFINAAKSLKLCELIDAMGNERLVEPYMVYTSAKGKRLFHCYQLRGYSESGKETEWKNPAIGSFVRAVIRTEVFVPRNEYNPFNYKMFSIVHFSIPTLDGRQR